MNKEFSNSEVSEIVGSIRDVISKGDSWIESGENGGWYVESAFIRLRMFLEAAGLSDALSAVNGLQAEARENYGEVEFNEYAGEPYLMWGGKIRPYLTSIELIFGDPRMPTVTKDIVEILRETQYFITDANCFSESPTNEADVHARIEAVLRCVFPDLISKPHITKQIKNFEPDTGIPSISTLIEYKFVNDQKDAKRVADEVLADTRGYVSKEWDKFIYLIYETKRIRPEKQWRQLLRSSGVGINTEIIVISGEEPKRIAKLSKDMKAGL